MTKRFWESLQGYVMGDLGSWVGSVELADLRDWVIWRNAQRRLRNTEITKTHFLEYF